MHTATSVRTTSNSTPDSESGGQITHVHTFWRFCHSPCSWKWFLTAQRPELPCVRLSARFEQTFTEALSAKTAEVRRERRRADRLLCQMLPTSVALQLKSMHSVSAESFEAVTVLFSDIVDFPSIAANSTPIQVSGPSPVSPGRRCVVGQDSFTRTRLGMHSYTYLQENYRKL